MRTRGCVWIACGALEKDFMILEYYLRHVYRFLTTVMSNSVIKELGVKIVNSIALMVETRVHNRTIGARAVAFVMRASQPLLAPAINA